MNNPIAYTYEASEHCVECAEKRFGLDEFGNVPEGSTDNEGNEIGAVFSWDEWDRTMSCGTCGTIIREVEDEEPTEPEEEDWVINDVPGGYVAAQVGGRGLMFTDRDEAEEYIRDSMKESQFYPNVWFISDHGNAMLLDFSANKPKIEWEDVSAKVDGTYLQGGYRGMHCELLNRNANRDGWNWSFYDDKSPDPDLAVARSDTSFAWISDAEAELIDYIDSYIYDGEGSFTDDELMQQPAAALAYAEALCAVTGWRP